MIEVEHRLPQHILRQETEIRDHVRIHVTEGARRRVSHAELGGLSPFVGLWNREFVINLSLGEFRAVTSIRRIYRGSYDNQEHPAVVLQVFALGSVGDVFELDGQLEGLVGNGFLHHAESRRFQASVLPQAHVKAILVV